MRFTEARKPTGKMTLNLKATMSMNKQQGFVGGRWTMSALVLIASNVKWFLETMLSFKDTNHYIFAERRALSTRIRGRGFYSQRHIPGDLKSILNRTGAPSTSREL